MNEAIGGAATSAPPTRWNDAELAVYERVRHFVADAADVELAAVTPNVDIFEQLKVDSLGLVLILVNLEDEYNLPQRENSAEVGRLLRTPVDIVEFAMSAVGRR